jgi:hypothetical protein
LVSGVDLVDGTPVFDIKPYLRYVDSVPEAVSGFADEAPSRIPVLWEVAVDLPEETRRLIGDSLSLQPQPAYHDDAERLYATEIDGWRVRWIVRDGEARVRQCDPVS